MDKVKHPETHGKKNSVGQEVFQFCFFFVFCTTDEWTECYDVFFNRLHNSVVYFYWKKKI